MLDSFLTYINEKQLFTVSDRLLIAVSGGIDSVALVNLCYEAGFQFGIAHCNFQLRGEESDYDERFVRELAYHYKADFFVRHFDTKMYAKQNGVSTQMAARDLRYQWFEEVLIENEYDYLLTAHHQDDLLETILLNLTRGTGLAGLHGILPKNGKLVRPLLGVTRGELLGYIQEKGLKWREDSSNASVDYGRNRLRHEVVPILKAMNPQITAAAAELAERVKATEDILHEALERQRPLVIQNEKGNVWVAIEELEKQTASLEKLALWLNDYGFDYKRVKEIWKNRKGQVGKQYFSTTHVLTFDRQKWLITPQTHTMHGVLTYEIVDNVGEMAFEGKILKWDLLSEVAYGVSQSVVFLDYSKLTFPLRMRPWQKGDWFCPLGMNGKRKKISDFLVDIKWPRSLKNQVYVLESEGQIAWVIGLRVDERFKVEGITKKISKFEIL
ncbi:tRNA lysidine(34) synthetase TilS [Runella zeae]|uniref:tRNA lysidine(34) synthetase TilS n=1 Tax=Runella zeae TaxID=94255 RepID=UPI0023557C2B|nr:tRNA lysidine(34) synthetase TilS [Runella zeae]